MARQVRALIVDDSPAMRQAIMQSLTQTGLAEFTFVEAEDGQDAVGKFQPGRTGVIFSEIYLPKLSGPQFIQQLQTKHDDAPPAVLVTSETDERRVLAAVGGMKVDGFLLKPVDVARLRTGLAPLMDRIPDVPTEDDPAPAQGPSVGMDHAKSVPGALVEMLKETCQLQLVEDTATDALPEGDVAFGMISIFGRVQWSVVMGFDRAAGEGIATKFTGFDIPYDSEDFGDAIGEVTNMFAGQIKRVLTRRGLDVDISLPTVISAQGIRILIQRSRNATARHTYFNSSFGRIWTTVTAGTESGLIL